HGLYGAGTWPHPASDWRSGRVVFPRTTPDGRLVHLYGRAVDGWVRRWHRYHPLPEELGVRLAPHPAQAANRSFQGSDCTPYGVPELRLPNWVSNFSSG